MPWQPTRQTWLGAERHLPAAKPLAEATGITPDALRQQGSAVPSRPGSG